MLPEFSCYICGPDPWHDKPTRAPAKTEFGCVRCGTYIAGGKAALRLCDHQLKAAYWVLKQNRQRVVPVIDDEQVDQIAALPRPSLKERIEIYIACAADQQPVLSIPFKHFDGMLMASAAVQPTEYDYFIRHLAADGLISFDIENAADEDEVDHIFNCRLTAKGHLLADELTTKRAASLQGFVAMSFDPSLTTAWREGIEPAIRGAGYEPVRIDNKEHIDRIDDRIIAEIRRSLFAVVDLTLQRPNVYYEAGFAFGMGKPVIYTCRNNDHKNLHFDIRQYNCITWAEPADLSDRLRDRIGAVLGQGPHRSTNKA